jgi:hypothetical protein
LTNFHQKLHANERSNGIIILHLWKNTVGTSQPLEAHMALGTMSHDVVAQTTIQSMNTNCQIIQCSYGKKIEA